MPSKGAVVDSGKPAQPSGASQSTPVHPDEILYNSPLKGKRKKKTVRNEPLVKKPRRSTTRELSTVSTSSKSNNVTDKVHIAKPRGKRSDDGKDLAKSQREVANTKAEYIRSIRMGQGHDEDPALKTSGSPAPKQHYGDGKLASCTPHAARSSSQLDRYKALEMKNADLKAKCQNLSDELEFTTSKLESSESLRISGMEAYGAKYDDLKSKLEAMRVHLQHLEHVGAQRTALEQVRGSGIKFPAVMIKALISTIAHEIFDEEHIDRETIAIYCEEILSQMDNIGVRDLIPTGQEKRAET